MRFKIILSIGALFAIGAAQATFPSKSEGTIEQMKGWPEISENDTTMEAPPAPPSSLSYSFARPDLKSEDPEEIPETASEDTEDDDMDTAETIRVHLGGSPYGYSGHRHGGLSSFYPVLFHHPQPHRRPHHHHHHNHHRRRYRKNNGYMNFYG